MQHDNPTVNVGKGVPGGGNSTCKAPGMEMKADVPGDLVRSVVCDQRVDGEASDRTLI